MKKDLEKVLGVLATYKNNQNTTGRQTALTEIDLELLRNAAHTNTKQQQEQYKQLVENPAYYQQLLDKLEQEYIAQFFLPKDTPGRNTAKASKGHWQTTLKKLVPDLSWPALTAGICTSLLIFVFMLSPKPYSYPSKVDNIYAEYKQQAPDISLATHLPARSKNTRDLSDPSSELYFIIKGMLQGFTALDTQYHDANLYKQNLAALIKSAPPPQTVSKQQQSMMRALGKLNSLAYLRCKHALDNDTFTKVSLPLFEELIDKIDYKELDLIRASRKENINTQEKLCLYSNLLIDLSGI